MKLRTSRRTALAAVLAFAMAAAAAAPPDPAQAMLARYGGSYDADALLKEPAVRTELARLLGGELKHLQRNLSVAGGIGIVGGVLSYDGNADHQGGQEEAVVCVAPPGSLVEAAILSRRT
ncbi:MAG: hypothetical protein ABI641_01440, partial [Caldimonas sp.]